MKKIEGLKIDISMIKNVYKNDPASPRVQTFYTPRDEINEKNDPSLNVTLKSTPKAF